MKFWPHAVSAPLLPLMAALCLGLALGYMVYARARVSDAIQQAAIESDLTASYTTASAWKPGEVRVHNLRLSAVSPEWSLQLPLTHVRVTPVLGGPRRVLVDVPEQRARLRFSASSWVTDLAAHAELNGLPGSAVVGLRSADVRARGKLMQSGGLETRDLALDLRFFAAEVAPAEALLRGALTLRGPTASLLWDVLQVNTQGFFASASDVPCELHSQIEWRARELRLEQLTGRCGDVSFQGGLAWSGGKATGALLLGTARGYVGLRLSSDELQPELSPDAGWLERQLQPGLTAQR